MTEPHEATTTVFYRESSVGMVPLANRVSPVTPLRTKRINKLELRLSLSSTWRLIAQLETVASHTVLGQGRWYTSDTRRQASAGQQIDRMEAWARLE